MTEITVASETLLALCERARAKLLERESSRRANAVMFEMPAFHSSQVISTLGALEARARKAIKLAGDGVTHVALSAEDLRKLTWALEVDLG